MKYITDKSKIKNGMFVATQDDVVFVRIGGRLIIRKKEKNKK